MLGTQATIADDAPLFSATAGSARQLFLLLKCIHFAPKAHVQISEEGLRFSVEDARVMQGLAFLQRSLFSSYVYNPPVESRPNTPDSGMSTQQTTSTQPIFLISLTALLESLQILSLPNNPSAGNPSGAFPSASAFPTATSTGSLLAGGPHCHIYLHTAGSPFTITLSEGNLTTTCELTTYDPEADTGDDSIPLARDRLALKIIMPPAALLNAITELAATGSSERLVLRARRDKNDRGKYILELGANGPLGSAVVEFAGGSPAASFSANNAAEDQNLLETFQLARTVRSSYKFTLLTRARRAMSEAVKVSLRVDDEGVLSLQFMIAADLADGGSGASFVDFRFVPLIEEEEDGGTESGTESENSEK